MDYREMVRRSMNPVFRMSQAGYCSRRLSAMMLGVKEKLEAPPWLARAAKEGVLHEQLVKADLRALGCDIRKEQEELREDFALFSLLGHDDGEVRLSKQVLEGGEFEVRLVDRPSFDFLSYYPLEVKSFSFNEFQRWRSSEFDVFPAYAAQESCYMHAKGSEVGIYVTKDRSGGLKQLFILGRPPIAIEEVLGNVTLVVDSLIKGELVEGEYDSGNLECRRCEFRSSICKPDAVVLEDRDLEEVLGSYIESRDLERTARTERERCRELILGYGKDRFKVGPYVASISWVSREDVSLRDVLSVVPREQIEDIITKSRFPRLSVTNLREV